MLEKRCTNCMHNLVSPFKNPCKSCLKLNKNNLKYHSSAWEPKNSWFKLLHMLDKFLNKRKKA